jgi:hypothetical protein
MKVALQIAIVLGENGGVPPILQQVEPISSAVKNSDNCHSQIFLENNTL